MMKQILRRVWNITTILFVAKSVTSYGKVFVFKQGSGVSLWRPSRLLTWHELVTWAGMRPAIFTLAHAQASWQTLINNYYT